jgi:hypothetical protein
MTSKAQKPATHSRGWSCPCLCCIAPVQPRSFIRLAKLAGLYETRLAAESPGDREMVDAEPDEEKEKVCFDSAGPLRSFSCGLPADTLEQEGKGAEAQEAVRAVGRIDPKRHIEDEVETLMGNHLVQSMGMMLDHLSFS